MADSATRPLGERRHYHWQASLIVCTSQHAALGHFPGTELYQRQHCHAFSVTSVLQQQMESLFSKQWQGDRQCCKRSYTSLFLLLSYCPHGLVWCPHKVTPAALGIPTLRASKAEAEATVPWNWRLYHWKERSAFPALHTALLLELILSWHYWAQTGEVSSLGSRLSAEISVAVWEARKVKLRSQCTGISAWIRMHSATDTNDCSVRKKKIKGSKHCLPKQLLILDKEQES